MWHLTPVQSLTKSSSHSISRMRTSWVVHRSRTLAIRCESAKYLLLIAVLRKINWVGISSISANPYRNLQTPVDGSGCLPSAQTSKPRKDDRCDSDVSLRALWWRPSSGTFVSVVHDYWPAIPALRKSKERKNHGCRSGQRDAVGPGMRHERWPHFCCC